MASIALLLPPLFSPTKIVRSLHSGICVDSNERKLLSVNVLNTSCLLQFSVSIPSASNAGQPTDCHSGAVESGIKRGDCILSCLPKSRMPTPPQAQAAPEFQ